MTCFKDKTFCCSLNCKNECGRKMSDDEYMEWRDSPESEYIPISWAYFCGEEDD